MGDHNYVDGVSLSRINKPAAQIIYLAIVPNLMDNSLLDTTFNIFGLKQHLRLACSSIQLLADTFPLWSASLQHSGIQPIGTQGYLHIFKHRPACSA
jgi:hypothetical protein